jgi:hypothetical protein
MDTLFTGSNMSSFPTVASRQSSTQLQMLTLDTLLMFPTLASPTMVHQVDPAGPDSVEVESVADLDPVAADSVVDLDPVEADSDPVVVDPDTSQCSLTKTTKPYAINNYIIYGPYCDEIKTHSMHNYIRWVSIIIAACNE